MCNLHKHQWIVGSCDIYVCVLSGGYVSGSSGSCDGGVFYGGAWSFSPWVHTSWFPNDGPTPDSTTDN